MQNTKKSFETGPSTLSKDSTNEVGNDDFQNLIDEELSHIDWLLRQGRGEDGLLGVGEDGLDISGSDTFIKKLLDKIRVLKRWIRLGTAPSRFGGYEGEYNMLSTGLYDKLVKRKFDRLTRAAYDRSIKAAFDTPVPIDDDDDTLDARSSSRNTRSGFDRLMRAAYDRSIRKDINGNRKRTYRTGRFRRAGFDRLMRADENQMHRPNCSVGLDVLSTFCDNKANSKKRNTDMIRIMRSLA